MIHVCAAGVMLAAAGLWANTPEAPVVRTFDHYQVIIERQPFGARAATNEVAEVVTNSVLSAEASALLADLKLTGLVQGLDGTIRAGLLAQKAKKSYFLAPQEMADGLRLLAVRYDQQEADLEVASQKVTLKLAPSVAGTSTVARATGGEPGRGGPPGGDGRDPRQMNSDERREWFRSMMERMRGGERGGEASAQVNPSSSGSTGTRGPPPAPPAPPMPPSASGERERSSREGESRGESRGEGHGRGRDMEHRLQEYQKELIKQGLPPLPIPLTPETDAQLVREGVLPPM